eukprot:Sspe_Gene.11215::Locus_3785_Transcript_3_3_Confidence_0.600_Length_4798::g.11215::m.11215
MTSISDRILSTIYPKHPGFLGRRRASKHLVVQDALGHYHIVSTLSHRDDYQVISVDPVTGQFRFTATPTVDLFGYLEEALEYLGNPVVVCTAKALVGYMVLNGEGLLLVATEVTETFKLPPFHSVFTIAESRWVRFPLEFSKAGVQIRKERPPTDIQLRDYYYYCETYDITHLHPNSNDVSAYNREFVWNDGLRKPFEAVGLGDWCCVLLQGSAKSLPTPDRDLLNEVVIGMITRRSSLVPGTERMGIQPPSHGCENESECEVILYTSRERPVSEATMAVGSTKTVKEVRWSTFVFRRGMVPLPMSAPLKHASSESEPFAGCADFWRRALCRYGAGTPIVCFSMLSSASRNEAALAQLFTESLAEAKKPLRLGAEVHHIDWPSSISQHAFEDAVEVLWDRAIPAMVKHGVSSGTLEYSKAYGTLLSSTIHSHQEGICRVSCSDGVERTGWASVVLGLQVVAECCRRVDVVQHMGSPTTAFPMKGFTRLGAVNDMYSRPMLENILAIFLDANDIFLSLYNMVGPEAGGLFSLSSFFPMTILSSFPPRLSAPAPSRHLHLELKGLSTPPYPISLLSPATPSATPIPSAFPTTCLPEQVLFSPIPFELPWVVDKGIGHVALSVMLPHSATITELVISIRHEGAEMTSPTSFDLFLGNYADSCIVVMRSTPLPCCEDKTQLHYPLPSYLTRGSAGQPGGSKALYPFNIPLIRHFRFMHLVFYSRDLSSPMAIGSIQAVGLPAEPAPEIPQLLPPPDPTADRMSVKREMPTNLSFNSVDDTNPKVWAGTSLLLEEMVGRLGELSVVPPHPPLSPTTLAAARRGGLPVDILHLIETVDHVDTDSDDDDDDDDDDDEMSRLGDEDAVSANGLLSGDDEGEEGNNGGEEGAKEGELRADEASAVDTVADTPHFSPLRGGSATGAAAAARGFVPPEGKYVGQPTAALDTYQELIAKLPGKSAEFSETLHLEHQRLALGLPSDLRNVVLHRQGFAPDSFDPSFRIVRRDKTMEAALRKRLQASTCSVPSCQRSLKYSLRSKLSCFYCRLVHCRDCMAKDQAIVLEYGWDTPTNDVCHRCADEVQKQKRLIKEIQVMAAREAGSILVSVEEVYNRLFHGCLTGIPRRVRESSTYEKLHSEPYSVAEMHNAAIYHYVPTHKQSPPIDSVLYDDTLRATGMDATAFSDPTTMPPLQPLHSGSYWFAPDGVSSVKITIMLPEAVHITTLRFLVDPIGYTAADQVKVSVSAGLRLNQLYHCGEWVVGSTSHTNASDVVLHGGSRVEFSMGNYPPDEGSILLQLEVSFASGVVPSDPSLPIMRQRLHLGCFMVLGLPAQRPRQAVPLTNSLSSPGAGNPRTQAPNPNPSLSSAPQLSHFDLVDGLACHNMLRDLSAPPVQQLRRESEAWQQSTAMLVITVSTSETVRWVGFTVDQKGWGAPQQQRIRLLLFRGDNDTQTQIMVGDYELPMVRTATKLTYYLPSSLQLTYVRKVRCEVFTMHGNAPVTRPILTLLGSPSVLPTRDLPALSDVVSICTANTAKALADMVDKATALVPPAA